MKSEHSHNILIILSIIIWNLSLDEHRRSIWWVSHLVNFAIACMLPHYDMWYNTRGEVSSAKKSDKEIPKKGKTSYFVSCLLSQWMQASHFTEVTMRATITATILTLVCVVTVKSFDIKSFYAISVSKSNKTSKGTIRHLPLMNITTHGFNIL